MTEIQTNTWLGGMNTDVDVSFLKEDQYMYAENVRVITDTGILQSIEGTTIDQITFPDDEKIIGTTVIGNIGVIFTRVDIDGKYSYNKVYRVVFDNEKIIEQTVILKGDLKLGIGSEDNNEYSRLSVVGNYETDTNVKVYFTDGSSQTKVINVVDDRYVGTAPTNPYVDANGMILDPQSIDTTPSAVLPALHIVTLNSGSLPSGMIQYCYQLFNVRGTQSALSPLSELVHLTTSNTSQNSDQYEGISQDVSANKSCVLRGLLISNTFQKCRIISIHYRSNTELPTIQIVDEIDIAPNQTIINYRDTGNSRISELTVEELNSIAGYQFIAKTLEKHDNRLFSANIIEDSWNPEYDARAYRCNSAGQMVLESNDLTDNLSFPNINQMDFSTIPETHDAINPFNRLKSSDFTTTNRYEYGSNYAQGIKGGYGPNVSYRFVHYNTQVSDISTQTLPQPNASMNVESTMSPSNSYMTPEYGNVALDIFQFPELERRLPNHGDPYIAGNFRSYLRDEIYRFGIVLYNSKSIPSPVHWIGDIRMPHGSERLYAPFVYDRMAASGTGYNEFYVNGRSLGIRFTINNLPEDVTSFEIVRCDRTDADRTVMLLTMINILGNYEYANADTGELGGDLDTRPFLWPTYKSNDIWTSLSVGDVYLPSDKVVRDYVSMVSPEISLMQEDSINLFDNTAYIDTLYGLSSYIPPDNSVTQPGYRGVYGVDKYYSSEGDLVSGSESNVATGTIYTDVTSEAWLGMYLNQYAQSPPAIAKMYIPFASSSDTIGKKNIDIEDVGFPRLIAWNETDVLGPYYANVGNIAVLNLSTNKFNNGDGYGAVKKALGGPMIVARIPGIMSSIPRFNGVFDEFTLGNISLFPDIDNRRAGVTVSGLVANIKRSVTPYGGDTFSTRQNSVYISMNAHQVKNSSGNTIYAFGGDTYLGMLDQPWSRQWQFKDPSTDEYKKIYVGAYIPFETSINTWLFQGEMTHQTYRSGDDFLDGWLQIQPTQIGNWHSQSEPYFSYNSAYSSISDSLLYLPTSLYSEDNVHSRNRIFNSEAKTNNEVIDNWTRFLPANYLDVDNQYGQITNLKVFKNRLFYFQDQALGIAAVNERSLILDNNIGELTLGTGGILTRYDYLSTTQGDSTINDNSITNSDNVLYWYDYDKKEICNLSGGEVSQLSKEKQVQKFVNRLLDIDNHWYERRDINAFYDKKYNEVYFSLPLLEIDDKLKSLIFNEQLGSFTSTYTIHSKNTLSFSDKTVLPTNGKYYYINKGDYTGTLMDYDNKDAKIHLTVNQNPRQTKAFDNITLAANFINTELNSVTDSTIFAEAIYNTKSQTSLIHVSDDLDYREDNYRYAIKRADSNVETLVLSLPARMRGKYLISKYDFSVKDNQRFEIPYISTTYRNSLL